LPFKFFILKTKILIIRFSSIGDIVLTTPIIRCLKQQLPGAEIHYLTKKQFMPVIQANSYIHKIHVLDKSLKLLIPELVSEKFDHIVDLHKNLRSAYVILHLRRPFSNFSKLNIRKLLLTRFKINCLPPIHIVDRYFKAVRCLGVKNDGRGLDYFIPEKEEVPMTSLPLTHQKGFIGLVIGGKHATKQLPDDKIISVCQKINRPLIILGGKEDFPVGEKVKAAVGDLIFNACGKFSINQSASIVKQAERIITHDTGLMHIAAAFDKEIVSIWGNTVPEFGMYPYMPLNPEKSTIVEVKNLACRPCSKIGYESCPKKHFNCMRLIDEELICR